MAKSKSQKSKSSSATIGFEQQIWDAACELWGHIPAADYRKIFTGLIFLKYISTAFEKKYKELVEEGDGFEDDPDAYEADNIFFVPPEARWSEIAKAAHTPEIGTILDKAMITIEADNKSLIGRNVRSVRKVHSGARRKQKQHLGLWTGSQCRHLENGQNEHGNPRNRCKLWRSPGRYFFNDLHSTQKFDFIMANPPFNLSNWGQDKLQNDPRWAYGLPPAGNANYAWIEHMIYYLAPNGKIGLVLANGALSTQTNGEGEIRRKIIEADLIEGIVAMPTQLFYSVTIPVTLWFITRGKKQTGKTLFIDARNMGHMVDRKHRDFSEEDIARLADTFTAFQKGTLEDIKGFCAVATTKQIADQDYILTPGRYVGIEEKAEDDEPFADKMTRLTTELGGMFAKSHELEEEIKKNLEGIGFKI